MLKKPEDLVLEIMLKAKTPREAAQALVEGVRSDREAVKEECAKVDFAKIIYEAEEAERAKEYGEPNLWAPWEKQQSSRERRIYMRVADVVAQAIRGLKLEGE